MIISFYYLLKLKRLGEVKKISFTNLFAPKNEFLNNLSDESINYFKKYRIYLLLSYSIFLFIIVPLFFIKLFMNIISAIT